MWKTKEQIEEEILQYIFKLNPNIDTKLGSPFRTLFISPFAEQISDLYWSLGVVKEKVDIENLFGSDLDNFVENFGFYRLPGKKATGYVKFKRTYPAEIDYPIPYGTKLCTDPSFLEVPKYFYTTEEAVLLKNTTEVIVPVEAEEVGANYNVLPFSITVIASPVPGITSVTNEEGMLGGENPESDDDLKLRFINTIFKNVVGTKDYYIDYILNNSNTTRVNVIQGIELAENVEIQFIEPPPEISVPNNSKVAFLGKTQIIPDSLYIYIVDNEGNITNLLLGKDFTFMHDQTGLYSDFLVSTSISANTIGYASFEYQPKVTHSLNAIDIFVENNEITTITDTFIYVTGISEYKLNHNPVYDIVQIQYYNTQNQLVTIDSSNYILSITDNEYKNSALGTYKIKFNDGFTLPNNTIFNVIYRYYSEIESIQKYFKYEKHIYDDLVIFHGVPCSFKIYADVILVSGNSLSYLTQTLRNTLTQVFNNLRFGEIIQFSDIIYEIRKVSMIDNIKITKIEVTKNGTTTTYTNDFKLNDNEYPIFGDIVLTQKTINSWK